MKLTVFFSWQSDIDNEKLKNKEFLCNCIKKALKNLENKGDLKNVFFEFQESTSNIAGNPSIPNTIDRRIENCDVFIADLSIVDSYSKLELFLRKLRKAKTKRGPNNNAFGEYNKALASHSDGQIVTIMNYLNGDPTKDNSLIPFDTRERRFPIGYLLKSDKDIEKIKPSVVSQLENAIKASALSAIQNAKSKFHPFITHNEQQKGIRDTGGFIQTDELDTYQKQIRENKGNIRLVGLSGLGKTRVVFEAFKNSQENVNYLYCDSYTNEESSIIGAANKIFEEFKEATIVIDNCPRKLLEKIIQSKKQHQASNPIIAIYHDVNETTIIDTNKIALPKKQMQVVEGIIERYKAYYKPEQREKLVEFSGGIPLIAIRLCKSLQEGNPIGIINDETLLSKLLGTEGNSTERKMLRSLSLFDFIGAFEEARIELSFIANNKDITPIEGTPEVIMNGFDSIINKSIEREIMERNGRFVAIRPKPIGLQLTSEWISDCSSDRLLRVVKAIQNSDCARSLTESFSQHFKYMQHDEKAVLVLESLLQPNSPFHNAEVINTELGSRLFRSFVEVNPIAVANCLWSVFSNMNTEQIHQIKEGRRNLVWTLEKLCFDARTYEQGMKLLLMFGVAENETWGNNASNEFVHLFKIYLPGTQASLSERLEVLKWGINHAPYKELSLKAVASALETSHFSYVSGAENQGTKQLEHYQPKIWKEIFDYWSACVDIFSNEILNETVYSKFCCETLSHCISGLCSSGAAFIMLPAVKKICDKKNNDWDDMLDSLLWIKAHISSKLETKWQSLIDEMIEVLTKKDFASRYKSIEKRSYYWEEKLTFEEQVRKQQEKYETFAKEYVENEFYNVSTLLNLYQIESSFSHPFGYTIAKLIEHDPDKLHWFINTSIECFHSLEKHNPSILFDFARGLDGEAFDSLVVSLEKDDKCSYLLFSILANHGTTLPNTQLLFELVRKGSAPVSSFLDFWRYSNIITTSSDKEIIDFFTNIIHCNEKGFDIVITMLKNMMYFDNKRDYDAIADFIISEFESRNIAVDVFMQNDDYLEVIEQLLTICNKSKLAVFINKTIIEISKKPGSHISSDYRIERIYSILFDKYFKDISDDLFAALVSDNPFTELSFQFLLMPKEVYDLSQKLFQKDNLDVILQFCEKTPQARNRIMRLVPAIQNEEFSPFAMELLNRYGDDADMLNSLSCNIGSFGIVGSLIPVYESNKKTLSTLLTHSNPNVVEWAQKKIAQLDKDIAFEKKREAENKFLYG